MFRSLVLIFLFTLSLINGRSIYEINEKSTARAHLLYGDVLVLKDPDLKSLINGSTSIRSRALAKEHFYNRWPKNVVPIKLSTAYTSHEQSQIKSALAQLEAKSCFRFPKRRKQKDFLFIDKRDGCYSFIGRVTGKQLISLGSGCLSRATIQHEVMHALGVEHEHQRPDRDAYIRVRYENVQPNKRGNFDKLPRKFITTKGLTYDYASIMHYDSRAFGRYVNNRKLETMSPKRAGVRLNDNNRLSATDLKKLRILGKCDKQKRRKRSKKRKGR